MSRVVVAWIDDQQRTAIEVKTTKANIYLVYLDEARGIRYRRFSLAGYKARQELNAREQPYRVRAAITKFRRYAETWGISKAATDALRSVW